jgi:hypothetical protein
LYAEDGKALAQSRFRKSAIKRNEFQGLRVAIRGDERGAKLESVGRAQVMLHDDALGVKSGGSSVRDLDPS